jgi:hypothetical protein
VLAPTLFVAWICSSATSRFEQELVLHEKLALELHLRPLDIGHEIKKNGVRLTLGAFAEGADKIFVDAPESLRDIRTYRAFKATGIAALVIGLAALSAETAVIALAAAGRRFDVPLFISLLVIGLDVSGTGIGLLIFAPSYLQRAVATYNERVVSRALFERAR